MSSAAQPAHIFVVGSSYLYCAFYALPPLTNTRGETAGILRPAPDWLGEAV